MGLRLLPRLLPPPRPPRWWPGGFPTGINKEVAGNLGKKACDLDPRTWVRVLTLPMTCCEDLGSSSPRAPMSISVKWER